MPGFPVFDRAKKPAINRRMGCLAFLDPVKQCTYTNVAAIECFLAD